MFVGCASDIVCSCFLLHQQHTIPVMINSNEVKNSTVNDVVRDIYKPCDPKCVLQSDNVELVKFCNQPLPERLVPHSISLGSGSQMP